MTAMISTLIPHVHANADTTTDSAFSTIVAIRFTTFVRLVDFGARVVVTVVLFVMLFI